ncbi:MAG: acyl-CoA carboxylase epsilon subunit [Actinomycetota bacterium]
MTGPVLRAISPDATAEEIAAILAAVAAVTAATAAGAVPAGNDDTLHEWVRSARLGARRTGLQRGPWRLSGRIGRRARA